MKQNGFSLVEVLIGFGVLGVVFAGLSSLEAFTAQRQSQSNLEATLSAKKALFLQTLASDSAWAKTVSLNSESSGLSCLGSSAGCASVTTPTDFSLYDSDGTLLFKSSPTSGFNADGSACGASSASGGLTPESTNCALKLRLQWRPSCAATDINCRYPLVQIAGVYSSSKISGAVNLQKYSFNLNRSPLQQSICKGTVPTCAGAIAICESTGWTCSPPLSPYCKGPVSWSDSSTGVGPCTATIAPPGVLHGTVSSPLASTSSTLNGSAQFLCTPGTPAGGLSVQPSATCSSSPVVINGVCGGANGNPYASLALATGAGLCSAGSASSPGGANPWTWSCLGSGTGHTDATCATTLNILTCQWLVTPTVGPSFTDAALNLAETAMEIICTGPSTPSGVAECNHSSVGATHFCGPGMAGTSGLKGNIKCQCW